MANLPCGHPTACERWSDEDECNVCGWCETRHERDVLQRRCDDMAYVVPAGITLNLPPNAVVTLLFARDGTGSIA